MKKVGRNPIAFDKSGSLPMGIHECTLDQLHPLVTANQYRLALWGRLIGFLSWTVLVPRFSDLYLAGGFVSAKGNPRDIDVILQPSNSFGPESFAAVERFFAAGLDNIREMYSIDLHFWMDGAPDSVTDYRTFFQYERQPTGQPIRKRSKGIAKISLQSSAIKREIQKHLAPQIATLSTRRSPMSSTCRWR